LDIAEPTLHPKSMIDRITDSSLVLTSSLHGLILGHALGTPTQLVSWDSHAQSEPDFKYADYFSSIGEESSKIDISAALSAPDLRAVWERSEAKAALLTRKTSRLADELIRVAQAL
jgi:pyruvyltransferase